MNDIDPRDLDRISQIAHFFTMTFLNSTWAFFFYITAHPVVAICGVLPSIGYGLFHEFYWDPRYENAVTRGSDWKDFGWLMGGMLFGQAMGFVMIIVVVVELVK